MFKISAIFVLTLLFKGECGQNVDDRSPQCNTTIMDVISNTPELSILELIINTKNFTQDFTDPNLTATLLAPNNRAWNALVEQFRSTIEQLAGDPLTTQVLAFHIIPGAALFSEDFANGEELSSSFQEQKIIVDLSPGITFKPKTGFSNAKWVVGDLEACDAVVHVIDSVMVPDFSNF